ISRNGAFVVSTTKLAFNFIGLTPVTSYNFTVSALDHEGRVSLPSAAVTATTIADLIKPTIPKDLSADGVTQNSFTLLWSASSDNVGVTGYDVLKNNVVIGSTPTPSFN